MNDFLVVIPARMASTRLPGKVLADLGGRPVVEWCRQAALAARLGPVLVATDSKEVEQALRPHGAEVVLTPASCASGSDRVWAAADRSPWRKYRFIVNFQGDAPFLKPSTLRAAAEALRKDRKADIATALVPLRRSDDAVSPHLVKAALAKDGHCLYFSRSLIPWSSDSASNGAENGRRHSRAHGKTTPARRLFGHLGLYIYQRASLRRFVGLAPSPLETSERLEQLRALENGMRITASIVDDSLLAIDTPEDLERARALVLNKTEVALHG